MRKKFENTVAAQAKYISQLMEQKSALYVRVGELTGRVAELKTKLEKLEQSQNRPRFTLIKFRGVDQVTGIRQLADAYVIEHGTPNSFPLTPGYDDIEVYTSESGEI